MPARSDPQLNVRLTRDRRSVLDAAAFVRDTTAQRLVTELIETAVAEFEAQLPVQKALEARREQSAIDEGKLTHLRPAAVESPGDTS